MPELSCMVCVHLVCALDNAWRIPSLNLPLRRITRKCQVCSNVFELCFVQAACWRTALWWARALRSWTAPSTYIMLYTKMFYCSSLATCWIALTSVLVRTTSHHCDVTYRFDLFHQCMYFPTCTSTQGGSERSGCCRFPSGHGQDHPCQPAVGRRACALPAQHHRCSTVNVLRSCM